MTAVDRRDDVAVVQADRLTDVIVRVLTGAGASAADAQRQAMVLVEADLRAQHSHGLQRLPVLVGRLRADLIRSGNPAELTWRSSAYLSVDGGRGFGPVVAFDAVEAIIERARETGVALAAVHNANHIGILAPYVERIAENGQIGLAFTTSEALVHPWRGVRPLVGTNPIGIAVPTPTQPLVLDMSTAAVSMGKVLGHHAQGTTIPRGWAVDEAGESTTDPAAALRGALSPFGGAKGYALGVALEAMIGVLSASSFGTDVRGTLDTEHVASKGEVFLAIQPQHGSVDAVLHTLGDYLEELRDAGSAVDPVTVPGDRSRRVRSERLAQGIPVPAHAWDQAADLLEGSGR